MRLLVDTQLTEAGARHLPFLWPARDCIRSLRCWAWPRTRAAFSRSTVPCSVGIRPLLRRRNRGTWNSSSSSRITPDRLGWEMCSSSAALAVLFFVVLQKKKAGPVQVILASGAAGGLMYFIMGCCRGGALR
ncbi:MAG: hypothetical protein HFG62_14015 [Lachnospiraceae bacterium]|nr:hypothetical protein [Lachnospiraceae bacterium]